MTNRTYKTKQLTTNKTKKKHITQVFITLRFIGFYANERGHDLFSFFFLKKINKIENQQYTQILQLKKNKKIIY